MFAVFTDLDATLLDAHTYSFEAARPALAMLAARGIPCVMVTSKTRAEVEALRARVGSHDPFIVENGGAAFLPRESGGGYDVLEFGTPYARLTAALRESSAAAGCRVRAFHAMTDEEVARLCSLPLASARLARMREYDEPFAVVDEDRADRLLDSLAQRGLQWTHGGRFYHVLGNNDKGSAVSAVLAYYRNRFGRVQSIGLGDSRNDLEFLRLMDTPIVVRAQHDQSELLQSTGGKLTRAFGPAGWNEALLARLRAIPPA